MRLSIVGSALAGASVLAIVACSTSSGTRVDGDPTGSSSQAISQEHPGGVAQLAPRLYTSADVTLTGYAVPDVGGCTGEMIGPNFMMTASHCNDLDRRATFYTYRNQDPNQLVAETFQCHILLNTFWKTDMTLHYCDPNAQGENPGDKYGYLDFDTSQPTVGEAVYSYWFNPIDSLGIGWGEIYSAASIDSTTSVVWGPQGDAGAMNEPIGIGTNLWSQPGCSGSSILSASNYRIVAGPTSTGVADGAGRWAQSSKTDFEQGSADGWDDTSTTPPTHMTGVHDANIAALGLVGAYYAGKLDKNGDYLFDVQQDAERIRGENHRDWYYLGWESQRRNALWFDDGSVTFDPVNRTAHLAVPPTSTDRQVLMNGHVPLDAGAKYRVSFMMNVASASSTSALRISFLNLGVEDAGYAVPTNAGSGWQLFTFDVDLKQANDQIAFLVTGTLDATLETFTLVRDGAVMDFDTADKRYNWRNDDNGGRALILPDGEGPSGATVAPTTPNWAALALPTSTQAAGTDWPLRNRQLAMVGGTTYQICADVRSQTDLASADVANRVFRVLSAGTEVVRASFRPGTSWTHVCTGNFIPPSGDNNMQIGFDGPSASTGFYIDDISIQRQPCGTSEDGCASGQTCVNDTCQCIPKADPCGSAVCGTASDGCGHVVACGTCAVGAVCAAGRCVRRIPLPGPCLTCGCGGGGLCE